METKEKENNGRKTPNEILLPVQSRGEPERSVYLVSADQDFYRSLAQGIRHFGYQVNIVNNLKSLENALAGHISVAIIVDIPDSGSPLELIQSVNQLVHQSIPLMFISNNDSQEIRLQAIRAGGVAFYRKPIELVELIDKLDEINSSKTPTPYRVLVVEDQPTVASYYQLVLKMAGMTSQSVTDTNLVLKTMREFRPDLVLMDLYLPDISGMELARLIRQIDEFMSIPIVFLSSESDFSKHIEAMNLGGDDFLTKPIKASHLVALVKSRLERLRILRSYMIRDGLTGLLNHSNFLDYLDQQVQYGNRKKSLFAISIFDLDLFKQINDTYGHLSGDAVLKSISRLLKQRLRKSDIIGRYGGDEFIVLFPDQDQSSAFLVMDEIRQHFSEVEHFSESVGAFKTTFSCGIATFPEFSCPGLLVDAADQALYAAKAAGRNCVMVAKHPV